MGLGLVLVLLGDGVVAVESAAAGASADFGLAGPFGVLELFELPEA